MRGAIAITVLLTGCDLLFSIDHVRERDAVADGPAPCLGTGLLNICSEATVAIDLKTPINTTIDGRCRKVAQDNGPPLCVIDGTEIKVSEYVSVTGASPLVLLATKSVEIAAVLDASSKTITRIGAAAQSGCPSSSGANGMTGAGGGGGGTFGFMGGGGGDGQMGLATTSAGGSPSAVVPQLAIYGGCAGGAGGIVVGTPASGASGGGAIYIIAGETIHVTTSGSINASGGGGAGAQMRGGGGGGGGSGGFIALDAPTVHVEGPVFARGGGGGGGGGSATGGGTGVDPLATAPASGGAPGVGGGGGGHGCGEPDGMQGGLASAAPYGGGGGGGACGRIRLYGTRSGSGVVNPAPS